MTPSATDPLNKFNATEVLADTARAALRRLRKLLPIVREIHATFKA